MTPCQPFRLGSSVGYICSPTVSETRLRYKVCPFCGVKRRMLCEFQEWYGWFVTCLSCGSQWDGGEALRRSESKEETKRVIERAYARLRAKEEGT